jgi:hypothetical protein
VFEIRECVEPVLLLNSTELASVVALLFPVLSYWLHHGSVERLIFIMPAAHYFNGARVGPADVTLNCLQCLQPVVYHDW